MDIPADLLNRCFELGVGAYPDEACGFLSGADSDPDSLTGFHPMDNILGRLHEQDPQGYPRTAREGYVLDPGDQMRLEKRLSAQGEAIRVIFHTHVDVGAYFSEEDRKQGMWGEMPRYPGVVYLVCGVTRGGADGAITAVYSEESGGFEESEIMPPAVRHG